MSQPLIVLLDDSPIICAAGEEALAPIGEVRSSELWTEAGAWLLEAAPHRKTVLVSDLDMPGIQGGDFCQITRRHSPSVGVIAFTSSPQKAPAGLFAVVSKQDGLGALRLEVERFLIQAPSPAEATPPIAPR